MTERVLVPHWEACQATACTDPRRPDPHCAECKGEGVVELGYWADATPLDQIDRAGITG